MRCRSLTVLIVGICAVFVLTADLSATPLGLLRLDSGSGGVTVGINSIDWTPPTGGTNGAFVVGAGTTLTSAAGNPAVGSSGLLVDLGPGTPLPVSGFMTFAAAPGLAFDLLAVGPGSSNTNCSSLAVGDSCSIFVGSPIVLTRTASGTAVSLSVSGIARDGVGPNSNWLGDFTTQIAGVLPSAIQAAFGCVPGSGGGACTHPEATVSSTYSGEFRATATVPEPASLSLLGLGLISLAAYRRKKE